MMTKEQAKALFDSEFWKDMPAHDQVRFQLFEQLLCMPFAVFHEAVEECLGRPVFTHEFGLNIEGLRKEFLGEKPAPSLEEIIDLIPIDKQVLIVK